MYTQERALSTWAKRLQYYVYKTVGGIRMGQFFDIVTDLPESQPALADVRECLKHTSSHARFIQRFSTAIKQRLLHPGNPPIPLNRNYWAKGFGETSRLGAASLPVTVPGQRMLLSLCCAEPQQADS